MSEIIMLVGLPASGKSSFADNFIKSHNYILHSSDGLREELYGDSNTQGDNFTLFSELHKRIKNDLNNNKNVIYDATNINYKKRMLFLKEIKNINCNKKCVVVALPIDECIKRNNSRNRNVPKDVIYRMRENFNFPAYFEGWDNITVIPNYDIKMHKEYSYESIYDYTKDFNQDNPNHSLSLYLHLLKAQNYICTNYPDKKYLKMAAYMHDIGKLYTKRFENIKGEKTDIAHYYNHHNVSSYESMLYLVQIPCFEINELVKICTLIQWHMQPYFNKTEKLVEKYKKLWGEELFNDIMILHKADKFAH